MKREKWLGRNVPHIHRYLICRRRRKSAKIRIYLSQYQNRDVRRIMSESFLSFCVIFSWLSIDLSGERDLDSRQRDP